MKILTWIIAVVVLIAVAAGVYYAYQNFGSKGGQAAGGDVVQAQDVSVGTGAQASPGSVVSVLYVGKLSNGTVFDSSEAHGNQPLKFQLGAQGIIPGFQIGVNGMREGGERKLAIPPSFGYGAQEIKDPNSGKVVIPANSTLVFNVKLLKVEAAPATTTPGR